jgi:hypothetical protein
MTSLRTVFSIACLLVLSLLGAGCSTTETADTFRYGFSDVQPNPTVAAERPVPADFQLRAKTWKHEWRCDVFDSCITDFLTTVYVFDKRTGRQLKWNRVEVFMKDDCDASTKDRDNYKTVTDTDSVTIGWGDSRKGKYEQVSALLIFYADWGSVNASVRTIVCPEPR